MKQIFDWLREQMRERIKAYQTLDTTETAVDVAIKETERFIEYINEAESKWEAETCEWEHIEHYVNCFCKCNGIMVEHDLAIGFKFCPYCGKRIKISEVE